MRPEDQVEVTSHKFGSIVNILLGLLDSWGMPFVAPIIPGFALRMRSSSLLSRHFSYTGGVCARHAKSDLRRGLREFNLYRGKGCGAGRCVSDAAFIRA